MFEDEDLEAALDQRRIVVSGRPLLEDGVISGAPTVFRAPFGFWEADAVLETGSGAITPDVSDPYAGTWSFTAAPGVAIYVTGRAFDFWGAAADLCEEWAGRVAHEFDFGTDQQTFNRSQKRVGLLAVAREYGRRAIPPQQRVSW